MANEVNVIQLYGTTEGDNIANIDLPDDGVLLSAHFSAALTAVAADADSFRFELSFGSTSAFTTNDARSVICGCGYSSDLTGVAANTIETSLNEHFYFSDDGIKVFAGERIYLHGLAAGTPTANSFVRAWLVFRFQKFTARRR